MRIKINELLEQQGRSRNWLSKQTGIDYPALSRLCHNKTTAISFNTVEKLCKALHCTLDDLFELEDN